MTPRQRGDIETYSLPKSSISHDVLTSSFAAGAGGTLSFLTFACFCWWISALFSLAVTWSTAVPGTAAFEAGASGATAPTAGASAAGGTTVLDDMCRRREKEPERTGGDRRALLEEGKREIEETVVVRDRAEGLNWL